MRLLASSTFLIQEIKKIKSVSRLCVLPDYQGIGIGKRVLTLVAKKYADEGFDVKITTSAKNLIYALRQDKNWIMARYSVNKKIESDNKNCRKFVFHIFNLLLDDLIII